ncbi:hypothetical protein KAI87_10645, partial [Myxococcota bacterium]|nr:hypothetical protein [Myxococcota bacterium]
PIVVTSTAGFALDLDVDTNRDGTVDDFDDAAEANWQDDQGGVLLANVDDDDNDGARDGLDTLFNNAADSEDMTLLVIRDLTGLSAGASVLLSVSPAKAASRIQIFSDIETTPALLYASGENEVELEASALMGSDVSLLIEASESRSADWDGRATIILRVRDGAELLAEDSVELRVSPVIFTDNTRPAEALYIMRIAKWENGPNLDFHDPLIADLPASLPVTSSDEDEFYADRWHQDNMQTAYQSAPTASGERVLQTYLQTYRPDDRWHYAGLAAFLPEGLLGPDLGYAFPCESGSCEENGLNYGGNLEISPPFTTNARDYPYGRVVIGGGDQGTLYGGDSWQYHLAAEQVAWINAQEIQGPALEVSSEWLAVGHVDEFFLFVPDFNSGGGRPWKIVIGSPSLAKDTLFDLFRAGGQAIPVFAGRETETTVAALVEDAELWAYNTLVEARIDTARARLKAAYELD